MFCIQHFILICTTLTSSIWFAFATSSSSRKYMEVLLVELKSAEVGKDYLPPSSNMVIHADVKPNPNDKVARIVTGVLINETNLPEIEVCSVFESVIASELTEFFKKVQLQSVSFDEFRTVACKLDESAAITLPSYTAYTVLLGFTRPTLPGSRRQKRSTDNRADKLDGVYVDSRYVKEKSRFLQLLRNTFDRANVMNSTERFNEFGSLFRVQAALNISWNETFNNQYSEAWNYTLERFCFQLEQALHTNNESRNVEILCALDSYLPIEVGGIKYVRISAAFSTIGSTFTNTDSAEMTAIVNNGFEKLGTMATFSPIGNIQIIRDSQFFTCAQNGGICAKHAYCLQQKDGIRCVCALLFNDANTAQPGTDCRYTISAAALVLFPTALFVGCVIAIVGFYIENVPKPVKTLSA